MPFYLHPRNPLPIHSQIYEGHPWLMGPTWAFGQETAVHALRLIGSGLFDEYPRLQIVLGHMGEGLPYSMWRIDHRNAWVKAPHKHKAKKKIVDYFNANFYLTTSGNFRTQTLIDAMLEIGADRILFSTDWPFENIDHAADLVRRRLDQRGRPRKDRPHQRTPPVQAQSGVTDMEFGYFTLSDNHYPNNPRSANELVLRDPRAGASSPTRSACTRRGSASTTSTRSA